MKFLLRLLFGALALGALAAGSWYAYSTANGQPIHTVAFTGDTLRIAQEDLDKLTEAVRSMPPGAATLANVREAAKRLPWVRDASARRLFPDGIEVRLESQDVLARWSEGFLVNPRGEVFPGTSSIPLPRFAGPEGSSPEMAREYPAIAKALAPLNSPVIELRLSPRGAWQVGLESGLVLELGRGDVVARIERFAAAWPQLSKTEAPRYADLRYPNGFTLKRARDPNELPNTKPAAKPKRAA